MAFKRKALCVHLGRQLRTVRKAGSHCGCDDESVYECSHPDMPTECTRMRRVEGHEHLGLCADCPRYEPRG